MADPVVVVGGGVIGCSAAYYIARSGRAVTLLEGEAIACAASGKAGGFLARHMCDGGPLEALMRQSFDLHTSLARELGGEASYGYRTVDALSIHFGSGTGHREPSAFDDPRPLTRPGWLSEGVEAVRCPKTAQGTAAQLHPQQFTAALAQAADAAGATVVSGEGGRVVGVETQGGAVRAVSTADGGRHACSELVICAGPWSGHILRLIDGLDPRWVGAFPLEGRRKCSRSLRVFRSLKQRLRSLPLHRGAAARVGRAHGAAGDVHRRPEPGRGGRRP